MPIFVYLDELGSYDSICNADKIYSGEYLSGESIILLSKSPKRSLGRALMIVVAILKSRHLRGLITTESHPLNMATTGRDSSLGTIVTTMDSSVTQNRQDFSNNCNSNQNRNQFRNNSNYDNRQYNNNGMSTSNSNFQYGQGYDSRGNQNYEGFNPDSSYRTDQELDQG